MLLVKDHASFYDGKHTIGSIGEKLELEKNVASQVELGKKTWMKGFE